ncbi:unnamed protein product [Rotaria sordida]|uniref:C2H2-type domain-containing protein n=3 Tax=Rotaria sordida TaxID=392033 RepID=A0A813YFA4_9BILA|nr:unnamed protein product [Rotaria sordida]
MSDDASTAYICIYCPFNSDNLTALENHLTGEHGHGCQDTTLVQSSSSSLNIINKANKREAPDDEQSQSSFDGTKQTIEQLSVAKRVKRTTSPISTSLYINTSDESSQSDDDERDSSSNPREIYSNTILTCPICGSNYNRLGHLSRHVKRKHHLDLSNSDYSQTFDILNKSNLEKNNSNQQIDTNNSNNSNKQLNDILPSTSSSISQTTTTTTDCPYCDFKTTDIELFKSHIVAHIRDKNYRCLLCNRLYKYRDLDDVLGDCSFHIRRKHHRYSINSNDYIQRFLFDTTDGDESMSTQCGGNGSSGHNSALNTNITRETDEPVRYFGCPYCDYTSNYGGDVRKHQARKHPNAESKVVKIIRQECEQQNICSNLNGYDEDDNNQNINLNNKIKSIKKSDKISPQQHSSSSSSLPILSNFAPVRVFQCSSCHQQGTYKWVVERHIRAKHPEQPNVHVIELPAELSVKLQKITPPLKRFRCSLCPLQSKHSWVVIRHIKHFHTLQTASVLDIQPDGKPINDDSYTFQNDSSNKIYNNESETSSISSSCNESGIDITNQQDIEDDNIQSSSSLNNKNDSMIFIYKCSLCDYQSNISWNVQKHINDKHSEQSNAFILTQCQQTKLSSNDNNNYQKNHSNKKSKHKNGINRPFSPTNALAKAKFSPAVEEALLSLQGSKLNPILYAVQPKFGIKRLKCRHCFYRSNWKTDMIRHVRIRHNLTEPDHNRDMIIMTEQEARSTIESYENTFGKELRRRTFRTWNDWAKAEQEFTPKDGSLQYINQANANNRQSSNDNNISVSKKHITTTTTTGQKSSSHHNETKRSNKIDLKIDSHQQSQTKKNKNFSNQSTTLTKDDSKSLKNGSNIVSRLLVTRSPSHNNDDNNAPLDLSLKPSTNIKSNQLNILKDELREIEQEEQNIDDIDNDEISDESSTVNYLCSVCPYKHSNWSLVERHISIHLTGKGIICPLCSYTTLSHNSMIRHMTMIHPTSHIINKFQETTQILNADIIEQYQCPLCSYQCDCLEALNLHRRLEHDDEEFDIDSSDNDNDDDDDITANITKNLYDCPLCSPLTNLNNNKNLEELTMHVINDHNNETCPFCSFTVHTTSSNTLIEHIKLHFNGTLIQPDPIIGIEQVKELLVLE